MCHAYPVADCSAVANIVREDRNHLDFGEELVVHTLVRIHNRQVGVRLAADTDLEDRTFGDSGGELEGTSLKSFEI